MNIDKIKTNVQVRKNLGDLKELKASIQEKGILQPLLIDKANQLLAGHRRLQSAKELGLKEVPVHVIDTEKKSYITEIQLIENIQRKALDPIEESEAYRNYLETNKATIKQLAKAIGKTTDYVSRRVNLKNMTKEVTQALREKRIELGHALLLNQMKKEMQKQSLEFILEYDLTVQNFSDQIRWMGIDFMELKFRSEEKDGTEQKTLLDEIGNELKPKNEMDTDLKENDKFKAELGKYIESQRKILRGKGVVVFNNKEELIKKHQGAYEISSWYTEEYNRAIKVLPKTTKYAVVIDIGHWGDIEKSVYCLEPKKETKAKLTENVSEEMTEEQKKEADNLLERNREEKLKNKVNMYKHDFLMKHAPGTLKLNTKAQKAVTILQLVTQIGWHIDANIYGIEAKKILGIKDFYNTKKLLECTPVKMDKAIKELNKAYLTNYLNHELEMIMVAEGFKYDKHTVITKEFLELHSKNQLIALAKELEMDKDFIEASKHAKKTQLVDEFLTYELTGKLPKIMVKK